MKIENIQEVIKAAFEDKRIVVVRGGNMYHRDMITLGLKDSNIEGIDNIVFFTDANISKAALLQVMREKKNTLFVIDHIGSSIKTVKDRSGFETKELTGIGYSYFNMVNRFKDNNNKVLSLPTNENTFIKPYLESMIEIYSMKVITIK